MKQQRLILILVLIAIGINFLFARSATTPRLGQEVTPEEVVARDISIFPDGEGLPEGDGSVHEGEKIYQAECMVCHGKNGFGHTADQLAGAEMSLISEYPEKTIGSYWPYATTLLDYVRRAMPYTNPGTLSNNELYAITAYVLNINGIVKKNEWMDADSLPRVRMPNEDGFESALGDHSVKFRRETLHHQ